MAHHHAKAEGSCHFCGTTSCSIAWSSQRSPTTWFSRRVLILELAQPATPANRRFHLSGWSAALGSGVRPQQSIDCRSSL